MSAGAAYALASMDWCRSPRPAPPRVLSQARGEGSLWAGAAKVELTPPFPVTVAGYGPPRPTATHSELPLYARALVAEVGKKRIGWVTLDVLLVTDELAQDIRQRFTGESPQAPRQRLLDAVWVAATHTHSSLGGHDARPMAQLSGTGAFHGAHRDLLARAAVQALEAAVQNLGPASLSVGTSTLADQVVARSGSTADSRVVIARFRKGDAAIGQLVMLSAHPTLVPRGQSALHPDYPGILAVAQEKTAGITLVLQSAGGNAKVAGATASEFARAVGDALGRATFSPPEEALRLQTSQVRLNLPEPDPSRLVPSFTQRPARNFMCLSAGFESEVQALRLGSLTLWAVPFELSFDTVKTVGAVEPSATAVSLVGGYLGYLEPAATVSASAGESMRQYYPPELSNAVTGAVSLALKSLAAPSTSSP